jgi:hypothetical protein
MLLISMRRAAKIPFLIVVWMSLVALACNLGASSTSGPATLESRLNVTEQAPPTLGYATQSPQQEGAAPTPTISGRPYGARMYNLLNQVDENRLMNHVYMLEGFVSRYVGSSNTPGSTSGIGAAADYIYREFEKIQSSTPNNNFAVGEHWFTAYHDNTQSRQRNIVATLNGTQPGTGVIVIGAHYDSIDWNDRANSANWAPGADDNGSGVAAVIEIARILSQNRPRSTMIFIAFSAEEVGNQGSNAFVKDYIQAYDIPVSVMINVDTIGSVEDGRGNVNDHQIRLYSAPPDDSASRKMARMIDFIASNHTTDLEVVVLDAIDREGRFGDHFAFHEKGYAAVRFIEAHEDSRYREGLDTSDKVEPYYLARSTRTILTVMMALSDGLYPPKNITLRDVGNGTRRLVWEPVEGATGYVVALRRPGDMTFEQVFPAPGADRTAWEWDGFNPANYAALAVAAINEDGIMGPLSTEYLIR